MEWYIRVIKKYAVFSSRARRKEYWYFMLINFFIAISINLLVLLPIFGTIFGIVGICYYLALLIPSFAVSVRRLHDTNHSGFSLFLLLIPLVGIIILFIYLIQNGTPEENKYGLNPKNEHETPLEKTWLIPLLIILSVIFAILFCYLAFRDIGSREQFAIINRTNSNLYLNVESNVSINISRFNFNRSVEINGINYFFIIETGQHNLKNPRDIFHSRRNDEIDILSRLRGIFSILNIVNENNNIVWDLYDDSTEGIKRIEHSFAGIFWILFIE